METTENKEFIDQFKDEWRSMWRNRLDDKVRAEGIADKDYSLLSVDRGTVIIATRKFKLLDFKEILQQHDLSCISEVCHVVGGRRSLPPSTEHCVVVLLNRSSRLQA